jgi:hypothetical protein
VGKGRRDGPNVPLGGPHVLRPGEHLRQEEVCER